MKTFGDLKIGDKVYMVSPYLNKVLTLQLCDIIRWEATRLLRLYLEGKISLAVDADRISCRVDEWTLLADNNYAYIAQAKIIYENNFYSRKQIKKTKRFKRLINKLKDTLSSIIHVRSKNI